MKKLLFLALLCITFTANSQTELWTKEVSKGAFMSQLEDGKIFLKDKTKIYLVNNKTGDIEWENKVITRDDPLFFEDLPIMYFEGKSYAVIDATSGTIIDESKEKTEILNISYYWDIGRVVVEMDRDKNLHILNVDLNDLSKSWNTKVGPVQKTTFGFTSRASKNRPMITKDGSIVVVDKKFISIIGNDGYIKKRIEYKKKIWNVGFNARKNMQYVLEDNRILHLIDVRKGKTSAIVQIKDNDLKLRVLGDGSTISIVQNKELKILDGISGVQMGSHEFKTKIKKAYIDEESGRLFALTKKMISEIDHNTGGVKMEATYEKDFDDIYRVFEKTIVSGGKGSSPIDLNTLKLEYPKVLNIPPVQDYLEMGDFVGYTYQIADEFSLNVVDKKGEVVWNKKLSSFTVPSLDVVGNGLLLISGNKASFWDLKSGKSFWADDVKVDPSFTYRIDEETKDMFMYSGKRLFRFRYSDGSLSRSPEKFKFKDFDYGMQQPQIMVMSDVIFMKGSNTVFVISKDGTLIHEKTYKKISNSSTILEIANIALAAMIIGTGNGAELVNVYPDDVLMSNAGLADGLNDSWSHAEGVKNERRVKQNRSSNAFPYVFCKMENDKRGLVFINPSNGDERFEVVLDEKDPNYLVDDVDGVLYHLSKSSLKAYDLK